MQLPVEIAYRGVQKREELDQLIADQVDRLERVCDHMDSCRVAVEKPNEHATQGSGFRVRIDMTIPPGHEIVVSRSESDGSLGESVTDVIRDVFDIARRRLRKLDEKQKRDIKSHPDQAVQAQVVRKHDDFGFLRTFDGREIYFHANSVHAPGFGELQLGSGVAFSEEMGEKGPQATSVRIVQR